MGAIAFWWVMTSVSCCTQIVAFYDGAVAVLHHGLRVVDCAFLVLHCRDVLEEDAGTIGIFSVVGRGEKMNDFVPPFLVFLRCKLDHERCGRSWSSRGRFLSDTDRVITSGSSTTTGSSKVAV